MVAVAKAATTEKSAFDVPHIALLGAAGRDPLVQNTQVTRDYHALSESFRAWLGQPEHPSWMAFGQHASHEVGVALRSMALTRRLLAELKHGLSREPHRVHQWGPKVADDLAGIMAQQGALRQAVSMVLAEADLKTMDLLAPGLWPAAKLLRAIPRVSRSVEAMAIRLEQGNRTVHDHIAPAFAIFLDAESKGRDGVLALAAEGYASGQIRDPDGLIRDAFTAYQEARRTSEPAARAAAMHRGNLLLGIHEQKNVLQPIFDQVMREFGSASRGLAIHDPAGTYPVLREGKGNWAKYDDRMGRRPDGTYSEAPGTISGYFRDRLGETGLFAAPPDDVRVSARAGVPSS
ncbi:MAG: hypothetical protein VKO64_12530 [Candidatus Sericytochromatia bacterium]|nr:hypothetical protein [Candidatus Sericytochromatia bacterium]